MQKAKIQVLCAIPPVNNSNPGCEHGIIHKIAFFSSKSKTAYLVFNWKIANHDYWETGHFLLFKTEKIIIYARLKVKRF